MNHLVQAMNEQEKTQFRAIQNRCERQWRKVREAKSETARNVLFGQMVLEIGDVLGVEVTDHDLDPAALAQSGPLVTYDPALWGFTVSPSFGQAAA